MNRYIPAPSQQLYSPTVPLTTFAPRHVAKLWTTYQLPAGGWWSRVQLGAGGRLQSLTYAAGSVCDANFNCTNVDFTQGGYAVFDLMARWQALSSTTVQLNVTNVLDRAYYQTISAPASGNWYGQPRSVQLSAKWSLH